MHKALRRICLVAILGLTLVPACGGGGSRGADPGTSAVQQQELTEIAAAIQASNASWVAAENSISRLSQEQRALMTGIASTSAARPAERVAPRSAGALATALDWRSQNGSYWLPNVQSQGLCASSASFALLTALEADTRVANNNALLDVDYSEADLFACGGGSCQSGWTLSAGATRLQTAGVVDATCLAYTAKDDVCANRCSTWQTRLTKLDSWSWVTADATAIKTQLASGPVVATIDVYTDFYYYKSGTYKHVYGEARGKHAVVLIGYDDAKGYWIIQNSWGTDWGESGFANIAYGQIGIESNVLAMSVAGNPATVTALSSESSVALAGGSGQVEVSCITAGAVSKLEARCDSALGWESLATGITTKTCTYTAAGTYTPGCRVNGTTNDNVDTPITVGTITVTAAVSPASGDAGTTGFTVTCTTSGATPSSVEYRCDSVEAWVDGRTGVCTYNVAGDYVPGCRVNGASVDNVDTAVSVTGTVTAGVTAAVSPTSGTTANSYVVTCTTTGTPTSASYRCDTVSSWVTGKTGTCTYSYPGNYTPGCRVNSAIIDNVDAPISVATYTPPTSNLTVTAGVTPASGVISTNFVLTCTVGGGTPSSLKYRCDALDTWTAITTGNTAVCNYSFAGSYIPACIVNDVASDPVDAPVSVLSSTVTTSVSADPGAAGVPLTITCTVAGALPTSLDYRCDSVGSWQPITVGRTGTCTYANPGEFYPGCRVNASITDDFTAGTGPNGGLKIN